MERAADLNVVLGANIDKLIQGLDKAEQAMAKAVAKMSEKADKLNASMGRSLSAAGEKMQAFGETMTTHVTLPLALMGAGAIKAAADIEALQLGMEATMKAAGRSIGEARAELEALQTVAKLPGIDFERAVRGSIRLQNVKYSAEQARNIITELANAIAMTGGTAHELDSVTRQFGQMVSKGRILQEDMTIIQENMPAISGAMDAAFGTRSADKLRAMGVTAEEFVAGVTRELGKLPRVSGGLQNSLVNMWLNIRLAAAKFGETLDRIFDVRGKLDWFGDKLMSMADGFQHLSGFAQKAILFFAGLLAVMGPLAKGIGMVYSAIGATATVYGQLFAGMKAMAGSNIVAWWGSLNAVMRANVIGAAITVVLALAAAFSMLSGRETEAQAVFKATQGVMAQASKDTNEERLKVERLAKAAGDHNLQMSDRKKALLDLQALSPEYFKNLKIEKGEIEGLTVATQSYVASLLQQARAKRAAEKIADNEGRADDLRAGRENAELSIGDEAKVFASRGLGGGIQAAANEAAAKRLEAENAALEKLIGSGYLAKSALSELTKERDILLKGEDGKGNAPIDAFAKQLAASSDDAKGRLEALQKAANDTRDKEVMGLDAKIAGYRKMEEAEGRAVKSGKAFAGGVATGTGNLTEAQKAAKKYAEILSDLKNFETTAGFDNLKGEAYLTEKIAAYRKAIKDALDAGYSATSKEVTGLMAQTRELERQYFIVRKIQNVQSIPSGATVASDKNGGSFAPIALTGIIEEREKSLALIQKALVSFGFKSMESFEKEMKDTVARLKKIAMGAIESASGSVSATGDKQVKSIQDRIEELKESLRGLKDTDPAKGVTEKEITRLESQMDTVKEKLEQGKVAAAGFQNAFGLAFDAVSSKMTDMQGRIAAGAAAMAGALIQSAVQGTLSFKSLAKAALSAAYSIVRANLLVAVTAALADSFKKLGLFGLIAAPIAAAGVFAIFDTIIAKATGSAPKFAKGAAVYGPMQAVVGDNPGARFDPEIIAPLSKLTKIIASGLKKSMAMDSLAYRPMLQAVKGEVEHSYSAGAFAPAAKLANLSGGQGPSKIEVFGRISGRDILLASENAENTRTRVRGF